MSEARKAAARHAELASTMLDQHYAELSNFLTTADREAMGESEWGLQLEQLGQRGARSAQLAQAHALTSLALVATA